MEKISELEAIYKRWGEGPTPEQYYTAVAAYFAASNTRNGKVEVEETNGKTSRED